MKESIQIPVLLSETNTFILKGVILYLPSNCCSLKEDLFRVSPGVMAFRYWSIKEICLFSPCSSKESPSVPWLLRLLCVPGASCLVCCAGAHSLRFDAKNGNIHCILIGMRFIFLKTLKAWQCIKEKKPGKNTWVLFIFFILSE